MKIHVVKVKETVYSIAQKYNVPISRLIEMNNLPRSIKVTEGRSIIVPIYGEFVKLENGKNLKDLSLKYDVDEKVMTKLNRDHRNGLFFVLHRCKTSLVVSAYNNLYLTSTTAPAIIDAIGDELTSLAMFSYEVNRDGSLKDLNDLSSIEAANSKKVRSIMAITNLEDGQFSTELATTILSSEPVRNKLIESIIEKFREKGYTQVDVDFEYLGAENKERYVEFLKILKARLMAIDPNYKVSVALPPKTSSDQKGILYEGHDYDGIGKVVDNVYLMTYEWGYSKGDPQAVSPLNKVKEVMDYAITAIPKNKILMGIPLYGYDWTLPYKPGNPAAKTIDEVKAYELAEKYNAVIEYDEVSQAPYFNYFDENKVEHVVWFDDSRSYQAKFNYVKSLGILGLYNWVLGFDSPNNWRLIKENFIVKKEL